GGAAGAGVAGTGSVPGQDAGGADQAGAAAISTEAVAGGSGPAAAEFVLYAARVIGTGEILRFRRLALDWLVRSIEKILRFFALLRMTSVGECKRASAGWRWPFVNLMDVT